MTKQDAKSLTAGVKSLVDDLFEGNIKGFIEDGFSSAIKVLAGQSKGDMKILTAYKLAMRVRGTNPDVTVANVFMFNYAFKYDGLLSYVRALMDTVQSMARSSLEASTSVP
jgi:hypothetical protein